jgi:hypothetical protein
MAISGIYKIKSKIKPTKSYIGSAKNINKRWREHTCDFKRQRHRNQRLMNHVNKYGLNDLVFSILLECTEENLLICEQYFIDSFSPFFNICKKAESCMAGRKHSELSKKKMSESHKGHVPSEETRKKLSEARSGFKHSKETKLKMSKSQKNHPVSEETKQKLREKSTGKHFSKETRLKLSKIHKNPSEETKEKMRTRMLGNKYSKGNIPWNKGNKKTKK